MWRVFLLAMGVSLCVLGGEALVLDKVILANPASTAANRDYALSYSSSTPRRVLVPPEWSPWALLGAGAVLVLYSYSVPGGGDG
jgi:hypothetical protein